MRSPDELRVAFEEHLNSLTLWRELGDLEEPMRYALDGGGKRIRPVLCLATTEAAGGDSSDALNAAAAIELVHSFSLVHDDLPALDDDTERRGRPTVHVQFGEAQAVLVGDALLNEAFRLALSYSNTDVANELVIAVSGMIAGQYLDVGGSRERADLYELKTGRLIMGAVGCGLWVAEVPPEKQEPWVEFGAGFGYTFQVVDDLLDGDGLATEMDSEEMHAYAEQNIESTRKSLEQIDADTSVLAELVDQLGARAQQSSV
jgi:geranylgeranyl pyrophosphate synthase